MTPESQLCADCGMCCDGTLFAHGVLAPGEAEPPGAAVAWQEEARCFAQPCPQYDGGCAIYADRPSACRDFRCDVLKDLAAGEVDAATATAQIAQVKAVADDLARALGVRTGVYAAARAVLARQEAAEDTATFATEHRDALLKIRAFSAISKQYMLRPTAEGDQNGGS